MGFFKNLFGLAVAGTAAYGAIKVTKKYQENKAIEQMAAAAGESPIEKGTSEVIGDIARATTEVIQETGEKVMDTISDVKEKINNRHVFEDYDEDEDCCGGEECDDSEPVEPANETPETCEAAEKISEEDTANSDDVIQ